MHVGEETLDLLLAHVQKPGRYVGQEWNSVVKDWDAMQVKLALAYPDTYEIGMSNLGLMLLYDLVNQRPNYVAERIYAPWNDMEAAMRAAHVPLYSLETRHSLDEFDVIGFSLQHELTYTNVLNMLDLGQIPVLAKERSNGIPLIIAGGSCTYNPGPMADFIDLFVIGEGEQVLLELLDGMRDWKLSGAQTDPEGRQELLRQLAAIPGVYVPSLYHIHYRDDGTIGAIEPATDALSSRIRKRIVPVLGPAPARPIVPNTKIVHERAMVEIQRGCSRGCRFCQAGMIYRPIRERPVDEILDSIDKLIASTGYDEVSLVSLSSSDHSGIEQVISQTLAKHADKGLGISLPSLRIDSFSVRLAEMIQSTRKTGFTFAPEAGSQRLRDVINKGVSEQDLLRTTEAAFHSGWNRIKLYFMLGLPTETDQDIIEIVRLVRDIHARGKAIRRRHIDITVSVSTFVPKPHTPFQWVPLVPRQVVEHRQGLLRENLRRKGIRLSWSEWDHTWLESILSRGDRRLGAVIYHAWRLGARFDAWREHFQASVWHQAFEEEQIDAAFYTSRERSANEVFPWDHIDVGVTRRFLWSEYQRALQGELSPDCRQYCHNCGITAVFADERIGLEKSAWGCP
jgi:radical SAM family uncharacterized protein